MDLGLWRVSRTPTARRAYDWLAERGVKVATMLLYVHDGELPDREPPAGATVARWTGEVSDLPTDAGADAAASPREALSGLGEFDRGLGALLLAVGALTVAVARFAPFLLDPAAARAWITGFGPYAPLVFLGLQSTQVVVAPVPGQLLAVTGGYLFGPLAGTLYSVAGVLAGSAAAMGLTRRYGRPYAESIVDDGTMAEFDAIVAATGEAGLFVAFLLPVFPDDALCFIAGLTDVPLPRLLVLVLVGRAPTFVAAAYLGDAVATSNAALFAFLLLAGGLFTAVGYRKREALATIVGETRHEPTDTDS